MNWSYRDKRGRFRSCRINDLNKSSDDPMNVGAPMDDIYNDARKRDLREGCPRCRAEVMENASEPDVMQRWELR